MHLRQLLLLFTLDMQRMTGRIPESIVLPDSIFDRFADELVNSSFRYPTVINGVVNEFTIHLPTGMLTVQRGLREVDYSRHVGGHHD
jgi:hypothetical protein